MRNYITRILNIIEMVRSKKNVSYKNNQYLCTFKIWKYQGKNSDNKHDLII